VPERQHVLPKDLPNALKHLSDQELDSLVAASLEEAKRRGRAPAGIQTEESVAKRSSGTDDRRQGELAVSLTRGQINAVRAAFKAGIKPSLIARQFGISQSDVRKVLASDTAARRELNQGGESHEDAVLWSCIGVRNVLINCRR
jgi:DNA invertase Pin-like site-specific DNA recombinase